MAKNFDLGQKDIGKMGQMACLYWVSLAYLDILAFRKLVRPAVAGVLYCSTVLYYNKHKMNIGRGTAMHLIFLPYYHVA